MAISTAFHSIASARSQQFIVAIGLCLVALTGCSRLTGGGSADDPSSSPLAAATESPSETSTHEVRPEVPSGVLLVSKLFAESALNYDACSTCSDTGFLLSAELVATRAEFERLAQSARAHLPWTAMQSRHERSRLDVVDIHGKPSRADTWIVLLSGKRTIRTTSATSRSFVQVRLTVVRRGDVWKISHAQGAGL